MSKAEEIREFVLVSIVKPARRKGEESVTFTAFDIHRNMGLKSRYPLVCRSIDTEKFLNYASVKLVKREGPYQGTTARWTFKI